MTIRDLVQSLGGHPWLLLIFFILPPAITFGLRYAHRPGEGERMPWRFVYAGLVYAVCVPGIFAAVLTAYSLFFRNESLLDVNLLVYFLPIISMFVTLVFMRQNVDFKQVPGFDRLSGLMVLLGVSFVVALAIQRTRIWVLFGGSIGMLFGLALFAFLLLKWATHRLFRKSSEAPQERPRFPYT
ncbi:MAG: hypothetical protein KBG20_00595 [Caldilineaceae bacterium]|nr:hypothetical protein [Caldilineaceae bacterium]MBP8108088.1 hypothetical protein [Caldilineaceae bacterium]MBP8123110.1 hypothetical protein [Caldilineaceae bacterium]MBP9070757.1 hypothetical protein [Caldilineaceae bacterium]